MDKKCNIVNNSSELASVLCGEAKEIIIHGKLASDLHYSVLSTKLLRSALVILALFVLFVIFDVLTELTVPISIAMAIVVAVLCIPFISLRRNGVNLSIISKLKQGYRLVTYDTGMRTLHVVNRQ